MTNKILFDEFLSGGHLEASSTDPKKAIANFETQFSEYLPPNKDARILDFGCGMGHFLYYLKEKGYTNFVGVDIGKEQVKYCKKNITESVIQVDNMSQYLRKQTNSFDLVMMKDVIEHLLKEDIVELLTLVRQALRNQGTLIVETGNIAPVTGVYLRYKDFTHEVGFAERSLQQVLYAAGFRKIEIRGNKHVVTSVRSLVGYIMRKSWFFILRIIYYIERGSGGNPKIFSKLLIAIARK